MFVFMWKESGVPGGIQPARLGDHYDITISHSHSGCRTRTQRLEVTIAPVEQLNINIPIAYYNNPINCKRLIQQ